MDCLKRHARTHTRNDSPDMSVELITGISRIYSVSVRQRWPKGRIVRTGPKRGHVSRQQDRVGWNSLFAVIGKRRHGLDGLGLAAA